MVTISNFCWKAFKVQWLKAVKKLISIFHNLPTQSSNTIFQHNHTSNISQGSANIFQHLTFSSLWSCLASTDQGWVNYILESTWPHTRIAINDLAKKIETWHQLGSTADNTWWQLQRRLIGWIGWIWMVKHVGQCSPESPWRWSFFLKKQLYWKHMEALPILQCHWMSHRSRLLRCRKRWRQPSENGIGLASTSTSVSERSSTLALALGEGAWCSVDVGDGDSTDSPGPPVPRLESTFTEKRRGDSHS